MLITRKSLMTGKLHTLDVPVTPAELDAYRSSNVDVQNFFPHLTPAQREFINTGITAEEWATLPDEDDENDPSELQEDCPMTAQQSPSLDPIFWVGSAQGAAVINSTTGKTYALITKTAASYDLRLFLGWFHRLRFWRRLLPFERKEITWGTFCSMELEFERMFEAAVETDQVLETLGVLPLRVEPWERYYLLRPMAEERSSHGKQREGDVGLDMYACTTSENIGNVDFAPPDDAKELFYWRTHPNLHRWMQARYKQKGGKSTKFVGLVRLDSIDLAALEKAVKADEIPQTFSLAFWMAAPREKKRTLSFVRRARKAIASGKHVFYYAP